MNLHHPIGCDCYECVCDMHQIKQEPPPYTEEEPMPPDPAPAPLTEADLKSCSEYITSGIPLPRFVQERLLAAARENAERERTVGTCQKCGTRVAVKHGRVEEGGLLFHDVCHWIRQREVLTAENAGLREERDAALARVAELEKKLATIRDCTSDNKTATFTQDAIIPRKSPKQELK